MNFSVKGWVRYVKLKKYISSESYFKTIVSLLFFPLPRFCMTLDGPWTEVWGGVR